MTERASTSPPIRPRKAADRKRRMSKGSLRALAWVGGGISFLAPGAMLAVAPRAVPATPAAQTPQQPRTVIVHHIVRKVITRQAPASGGGAGAQPGGVIVVPAPASAPVASTGGTPHP
jgi:hypothetical protein